MSLVARLEEWKAEGRPIGFSPWRDAEGMLWGIITNIGKASFTVDEISSLGEPKGEHTYPFRSISYFTGERTYSERLSRLRNFTPAKPDMKAFVRDRAAVRQMLEGASQSGEVCRIRLRSEHVFRCVRILSVDKDWAEFVDYGELMEERDREIWRVSTVQAVQWRTASEEAAEFLLGFAKSG